MTLIQPFRALRPAPGRAAEILAPPYDVLSSDEARARAGGKPWSFLHVSKPEIDLARRHRPLQPSRLRESQRRISAAWSAKACSSGMRAPSYYVYRLTRAGRAQTGLAAVASLVDYRTNRIRKHELTTPAKEDDRVRQIEAVNAETGPVMMAYPRRAGLDAILARAAEPSPDVDVTLARRCAPPVVAESPTRQRLRR